jgi:hypothetical protein
MNNPLPEHLSYSSISSFLTCPRAWKLRYLDKVQTPTAPELVFGSAFHDTIEAVLAGRAAEGDILSTWQAAWQKRTEGAAVDWGTDTPEFFNNEGVRMLSAEPIRKAIRELACGVDSEGPKIERKVVLSVPGVPIPIVGYIDAIDPNGTPMDLKTSARSWTNDKAMNELQPLFYLAALNQAGIRVPDWQFVHVVFVKTKTPQVQIIRSGHTPAQVLWLMSMIRGVWQAIEAGAFYENPTGWLCDPKYCNYWGMCRGRYG